MTAALIDGREIAAALRRRVSETAAALHAEHGVTPGLATIVVGDDPASHVYVSSKARACAASGLASFENHLPASAPQSEVLALLERLHADDRIDGILVQLPLPEQIDPGLVVAAIDPAKDVDGFHPVNIVRLWGGEAALVPCTPQGCVALLRSVQRDWSGAEAVVLGRSQIVGRPMTALLLDMNCTVTVAHSQTRDLPAACRRADILVAAVGRPGTVKGGWIKPGATVIDVGINRVAGPDGGLVGDVDFEAARAVAGAITPVPGGVGPMTIACLLRNTVLAAHRRRGIPDPVQLSL
jgi:methylenetetrahydrofolate dehydrogenase (NADP+)/methenyltetrahydrofolate cyclohydrolase